MSRIEDDLATPIEHQHDAEGARFRDWRQTHPGQSWDAYQRAKKTRGSLGDLAPRAPLSPEAEQRAFRRDHDTGDLDARERELLSVGIAPALTPARFARRFGGIVGVLLLMLSFVVGKVFSWLVAIPFGVLGLGVFLVALFQPGTTSDKPHPKRKR